MAPVPLTPTPAMAAIMATSTAPIPAGVGLKLAAPAPAVQTRSIFAMETSMPAAFMAKAKHATSAYQLTKPNRRTRPKVFAFSSNRCNDASTDLASFSGCPLAFRTARWAPRINKVVI
jgi:hypothetical protein